MTHLDEKALEAAREQPGTNHDGIIRAYLSALSSTAVAEREPVAWRWKPKDSETWIYDPKHEWLEAQSRDEIDAEPLYLDPPPTSELEAENARLKEARHFWKTEYLNASADAAKFANDLVRAEAQRDEALKALEPFAAIEWADEDGWSHDSPYRERVCDWFGPSDFRAARRVREGGKVE